MAVEFPSRAEREAKWRRDVGERTDDRGGAKRSLRPTGEEGAGREIFPGPAPESRRPSILESKRSRPDVSAALFPILASLLARSLRPLTTTRTRTERPSAAPVSLGRDLLRRASGFSRSPRPPHPRAARLAAAARPDQRRHVPRLLRPARRQARQRGRGPPTGLRRAQARPRAQARYATSARIAPGRDPLDVSSSPARARPPPFGPRADVGFETPPPRDGFDSRRRGAIAPSSARERPAFRPPALAAGLRAPRAAFPPPRRARVASQPRAPSRR